MVKIQIVEKIYSEKIQRYWEKKQIVEKCRHNEKNIKILEKKNNDIGKNI